MSGPVFRLAVNDRVIMRGVEYRVHATSATGYVFEIVGQPGASISLTYAEFADEVKAEGFRFEVSRLEPGRAAARSSAGVEQMRGLPADEIRGILLRQAWVEAFLSLEASGEATRSDASIAAAIPVIHEGLETARLRRLAQTRKQVNTPARKDGSDLPIKKPCCKTLLRWVVRYLVGGRSPLALRYGQHRSGNTEVKIVPELVPLVDEAAASYASLQRPTRAECFRNLRIAVLALNRQRAEKSLPPLRCPPKKLIDERIEDLPEFETYASRHGAQKALAKYGPLGAGLDLTRAGERIEMDEWLVQAITLLEHFEIWETLDAAWKETAVNHRLWACVAECAKSAAVLGLSFAIQPNTTENALACLAMVVSDKTRLAKWAGAESSWDMACSPEEVATDGGSGFICEETNAAVGDLTGRPFNPIARKPHLRACIERLNRTFDQQLMPLLHGRTFSNSIDRGDYESEQRAVILDTLLRRLFVIFIVDVYHNTPHGGPKKPSPRYKWDLLVSTTGISPPPGSEVRRNVLGVTVMRTLGRHGVRVLGLDYTSAVLQERFRKEGSRTVAVNIDPADLGCVSVQLDAGFYTCRCVQEGMSGTPVEVWVAAEADLRRRYAAHAKLSEHIVLDAIVKIKALVADAAAQFGLGGVRPGAAELNHLETSIRISFPPRSHLAEAPAKDIRAEAVPRGTPVEPYAVISVDDDVDGGGQDELDPSLDDRNRNARDQQAGNRAADTASDLAEPPLDDDPGGSRRPSVADAATALGDDDTTGPKEPFYDFEDDDDAADDNK